MDADTLKEGRGGGVREAVLIHGLNCTAEIWNDVVAHMSGDIRTTAVDCPPLESVEAIADSLMAALPPRFHLVGYSFGGYVALAMLERHPQRIESLVLVGSSAVADSAAVADFRRQCIADVERQGHEAVSMEQFPFAVHERNQANGPLREKFRKLLLDYGAERYLAHQQACLARPDRRHVLAATSRPVLFISGADDNVVPLSRQLRSLPADSSAQIVLIPGAGHAVPLEKPAAIGMDLGIWIDRGCGLAAGPGRDGKS
jgi:pimeloyl-ACP methyl ester carboxylesterase